MKRSLLILLGFFALYALTAQHGAGWGDSAEFQDWIFNRTEFVCGSQFSNAHPFYVVLCRLIAPTPFAVTLVSAFFGALAVAGFYLCTRRMAVSVLFGLSHMLWWLSCVTEVQTLSLAMTAFETWFVLEYFKSNRQLWLLGAALLAGLHLGVHNFAIIALPVYVFIAVRERKWWTAPCWAAGASFWLYALATRGFSDVLFGSYGSSVFGLLPSNWTITAFNFALAALSFAVPVILLRFKSGSASVSSSGPQTLYIKLLLGVNAIFFVRYFVPDQSQFLLPTLFYTYLLIGKIDIRRNRFVALVLIQVLLPVFAYLLVSQFPVPDWRTKHEGRDDAKYFCLPWRNFQ